LITFQGKSIETTQQDFRNAVNEYIAWCKCYRKEKANAPEQKNSEQSERINPAEIEKFERRT